MIYAQIMMTEGDAIEYERLQATLSALHRILFKRPAEAKKLRHVANATARQLKELEARYA